MSKNPKPHTTESEIAHLTGLRHGGFKLEVMNHDARKAIENYLKAAAKRTDWYGIDKDRVLRYATALLQGLP